MAPSVFGLAVLIYHLVGCLYALACWHVVDTGMTHRLVALKRLDWNGKLWKKVCICTMHLWPNLAYQWSKNFWERVMFVFESSKMLDRLTSAPPNEEFLASVVGRLLSLSYSTIILHILSNSNVECCTFTKYLPVTPNLYEDNLWGIIYLALIWGA